MVVVLVVGPSRAGSVGRAAERVSRVVSSFFDGRRCRLEGAVREGGLEGLEMRERWVACFIRRLSFLEGAKVGVKVGVEVGQVGRVEEGLEARVRGEG